MTRDELARMAVQTKDGLLVSCWIQPRSSRNSIVGMHGDSLKIALTAPPVDGKANAALREFMADCAGLPKASVEIVSGLTGRRKSVLLAGTSLDSFLKVCGS